MINTVRFWDRLRAEAHTFEPRDCVISIVSPGSTPADIKGAGEVIRFEFFDVVERIEYPDGRAFDPVTKEQIQQIVDTVTRWDQDAAWKYVTVHCEAGVSRSGAVAAFIFAKTWCYFPTAEMDTHPNTLMLQMFEDATGDDVVSTAATFKGMGSLV